MTPLAERRRPRSLEAYAGQEHLVGPAGALRRAIEAGRLPSLILWGPPGVGKTSLAQLLARRLERPFFELSAISAGVKDVREAIEKARQQRFFNSPTPLLFIDEIHRFSKSQQDALLGAVERGTVSLIGATTENPSFEVIPALLSRCQVYTLEPLSRKQLVALVDDALAEDAFLRELHVEVANYDGLLRVSGGDARKLYNALELVAEEAHARGVSIDDELVAAVIHDNLARYDRDGEQHYDLASAFIKSIRGSDPNAALYYLARMLTGGEDVGFIGRRLIIAASEDIGMANPNALLLATTTMQAVRAVGMPEARILLAQCTVYLATSAKSNTSYAAIGAAMAYVKRTGDLPVPLALRNAPTELMKDLGYGRGYGYSHGGEGNFVHQAFAPEEAQGQVFYTPGDNPAEARIREALRAWWPEKYA